MASTSVIKNSLTTPKVQTIGTEQPWHWLGAGWKDMCRSPVTSVSYGLLFTLMGYVLIYMLETQLHTALALTSGFLLVSPFLAVGLYDISRRLEAGESASLGHALFAWQRNTLPIALFGLLVGLLMTFWVRLAAILFVIIMVNQGVQFDASAARLFFSGSGLIFLIAFIIVGALIAAVVFAISVVSIPMLLDRKTDLITAVMTSVTAVRINPVPMLLWAALIVIFTGMGLLVFFLGLAIAMPLIGHATWHAYRDLVDNNEIEQNSL
ncbi:MAG: hypothetical protein CSA09_04500 [Candidatus Contendobacter odensis]|uniref:DUF2189 domain-containing protein n=1 Tax=Candidatus Contendibacter odensensis TaxID=1400860 RepID=A0A2G6PEI5_9GAMM|nr:MAG: hypothetical protein CSA09_04500 [Candidatus Contendobacter odensis]